MMGLFPMFIRLSGRKSLVVGGGTVGTRKVMSLFSAGSVVTVVSPEVTERLGELIGQKKVSHIEGRFMPEHLDGQFLCVSAVSELAVGETVSRECRRRGVLVNVADDPQLSDFFFPSVVSRGDLVIAISSGGVSPSQVKKIREELETRFGPEYATVFHIMGRLRESLKAAGVAGERLSAIMGRAASLPLAEMIVEGRNKEIPLMVKDILAEAGVDTVPDIEELAGLG